jgi:hypothetical protein
MANPRASHGAYQPGKLPVNISEYIYIYVPAMELITLGIHIISHSHPHFS